MLLPIVSFVGFYSIYIVVVQMITAIDPIDSRLLSPLFVPFVVMLGVGLERGWAHARRASEHRATRVVAVALVMFYVVGQGFAFTRHVRASARNGVGYAEQTWQNSAVAAAAAAVPAGADLYTNEPHGLVAVLERQPVLPLPDSPLVVLEDVSCRPSYVAWFNAATSNSVSPSELGSVVDVTVVSTHTDGTIFSVASTRTRDFKCAEPS